MILCNIPPLNFFFILDIITSSAGCAYGIDNVVTQYSPLFIGNTKITFMDSLLWVMASQFLGFGFAGLFRRFLVKPLAMWWPSTLSTVSLFVSFHESLKNDNEDVSIHGDRTKNRHYTRSYKMSRFVFFWIAFALMFVYSWLPEFFFKGLQYVSILCLIGSNSSSSSGRRKAGELGIKNMFASSSAGVGLFSLTFDWQYILSKYLTSPWWAIVNMVAGSVLFNWILTPMFWYMDAGGHSHDLTEDGINEAINYVHLYNGNISSVHYQIGHVVNPTFFYNKTDFSLNTTAYQDVAPLHITPFFLASYASSFLSISSVISYVYLWFGTSIKSNFIQALEQIYPGFSKHASKSTHSSDIHNQLMDAYSDISDSAYLFFLFIMTLIMIYVSLFTPFRMPIWAVFLSLLLTFIFLLPAGVIAAVSGQSLYLNVITEFIMGLLIPGDTIAVMAFKSLGTNNLIQAMTLLSDLKLGHYLKIPPVAMVAAQMWGTFMASLCSTATVWVIMTRFDGLIELEGEGNWKATDYKTFFNAGE